MTSIAWSTRELVDQYNHTSSGHFFSPSTMRFFRSRLTSNYKRFNDTLAAFITTEQCPWGDHPRLATIRLARLEEYTREDGRICVRVKIDTLGDFNRLTLARAETILNNLTANQLEQKGD